jgi:hypothetical protein
MPDLFAEVLMSDSREQELRRATDSLEKYILVCAGLVAFGVILEFIFSRATYLEKVGSFIVALGLAAEVYLGFRLLRQEKELRGILDAAIAELNLENTKLKKQIASIRFDVI